MLEKIKYWAAKQIVGKQLNDKKPASTKADYVAIVEAMNQDQGESIQVSEPKTWAQIRLEGHAHDRGATKALAMYNSHKTKLQNQWINPQQSINSGFASAHNSMYLYQPVNYWECYILAQDPLFNKVFNSLSQTPFSKGGDLQIDDDKDKQPVADGADQDNTPGIDTKDIERRAQKYKLWETLRSAVRSEYVTGGCLVYLDFGLTMEDLSKPLRLDKMDMRKFKGFRKIDPINITAIDVNTVNPSAPDYMEPQAWYVIGLGTVHRSHFLKFEANVPEAPMRPLTLYFGMPLTQLIKQDIANSNLVSQGVANLINRFRYIYMKTEDSAFTTNNTAQLKAKLQFMSTSQDNFGVCPLKSTEDVLQLTTSLTDVSSNVEQCYLLISAKTDIPFTELMGKSAQGMDATGEGDRRKWYDKCRSIQTEHKPQLLIMYGIVAGTADPKGKYVEFSDYVFNPLEEATEKELAENIKSYSEVAQGLVGLGANPKQVFEWLKSYKQFHLDGIEIDTTTPGLEGYDDPDDPNGGGLPGEPEDITPQVLQALKAQNSGFNEPDHPRHADGKFASKGQGESGKTIAVRGNELAGFATTGEALRDAAREYYNKHLAGHTVEHHELGEILFSNGGHKKPISFSADERKLRLFPFLPDIIKNGEVVRDENDRYKRTNVQAFYTLKCPVKMGEQTETVRVSIRKDNMGKLYYDHVISKAPGETPTGYKSGGPKGVNNSIGQDDWVVNLFLDGEE